MRAVLHQSLGLALHRQGKDQEALENYDKSAAINPELTTDAVRAEILQKLKRYDEAAQLSSGLIARDPANPQWHKFHNDLLYRLGRSEEYLKSYDDAPITAPLLLSKALVMSSGATPGLLDETVPVWPAPVSAPQMFGCPPPPHIRKGPHIPQLAVIELPQ